MSAGAEVIAAALYAQRRPTVPWAEVPVDLQEPWLDQATVLLSQVGDLTAPADDDLTLTAALQLLADAAERVNTAAAGLEAVPWVDALHRLRELRATLDVLRKIDASIARHAYLTGEHGKRVLDGLGEVWVGRGRSKERWQSQEALTSYVEQKIALNDGEMPDYDTVLEWVAEVVPLTASSGLRVTPLRAVGLDVEDYRTSEPGSISVTLPT